MVYLITTDDGVLEVKATGDTHAGGQNFDNVSVDHFVKVCKRKNKSGLTKSNRAMRTFKKNVVCSTW